MSEMTAQQSIDKARRARSAPAVVTPLTKVNLALPFSKITVEEPGGDTAELASIVAPLAAVMERALDEPLLPELRARRDPRSPAALTCQRCGMTFIEAEIIDRGGFGGQKARSGEPFASSAGAGSCVPRKRVGNGPARPSLNGEVLR
jgi:hypothetical protein